MMNKQNSPSSNNSGTSSETSETQSVEENNTSGFGTPEAGTPRSNSNPRSTKSWRRMKEPNSEKEVGDAKRPPWRAVSVSTLPKPDKNALLRAKLLDASRRLRAGKCSVSSQTEIVPTKLLKEVNTGVQVDLIDYCDVGVLTDGSFTMKRDGPGEFILTYSVSQMTDVTPVSSTTTQTLLPKIPGDDFIEAYYSLDQNLIDQRELNATERKLVHQAHNMRDSRKLQLQPKMPHNQNSNDTGFSGDNSLSETDTDTTETKTTIEEAPISEHPYRTLRQPTYDSWQFNDFEQNETEKNFPTYKIMRGRTAVNSRLTMLSKMLFNQRDDQEYRTININAFASNAVDELILETNNLVDVIEDIKIKKELDAKCLVFDSVVPPFEPKKCVLPSDYMLPIIEQQEQELARQMKTLKSPEFRKVEKFQLST